MLICCNAATNKKADNIRIPPFDKQYRILTLALTTVAFGTQNLFLFLSVYQQLIQHIFSLCSITTTKQIKMIQNMVKVI